eukprot:TRINITY_DN9873_c0_g1_i3.p1 TRINITY_DN9873_c0_g1~~TRINITY_DN9873_c0_g1_i3.p1  ORF type:complete len:284 (+),score=46.61 TRINITY_DN9873_c0_g1_i3:252-1103(+)
MKMPTPEEKSKGRALPSNVVVQNRPAQRVYVFGHQNKGTADGHHDEVEMQDMPASSLSRRGKSRSFDGRGPSFTRESIDAEEELTYVLHAVETHHTLRGIALQYRVTVDQLKRFNNLWTEEELHSRNTIKVPAARFGALYTSVMEGETTFTTEAANLDPNTKTHTTMRPMPAQAGEQRREAFSMDMREASDGPNADGDADSQGSSSDLLSKYDRELSQVLESERKRSNSSSGSRGDIIAPLPRRQEHSLMNYYPKDWRVLMVFCLLLVILVPVVVSRTKPQML